MNSNNLIPKKIKVDKQQSILFIDWNDQHHTVVEFPLLRVACPCASCRGGHENMKSEPDAEVFQKIIEPSKMTEIEKCDMVGSYGLTIQWVDGHHYGIYTWQYLRALCNCEKCKQTRGK